MSRNKSIQLQGSLWMTLAGEKLAGQARVALLAEVAQCGSITQAAKAIGMSYKAAWDAIDSMNNLAGEPLVERLVGGKGGGGTRLTERGARLVENFRLMDQQHQRFVAQLAEQAEGMADDYRLVRRIGMKSSARNQFFGQVLQVTRGLVNDEVELGIAAGLRIVALITHGSVAELGLQPGSEAFALVKASSVILLGADPGVRLSARNQLRGLVLRVQPGAVSSEVVLDIGAGMTVAATISKHSSEALELRPGQPACAIFKASSVILGVPA